MANQSRENPARDEVLKRMLKMPPKPHKQDAAPKPKKVPAKKRGRSK
jgi:hypothetical protein